MPGWRPGAISKALLRKLNKAKRYRAPLEIETRSKKLRKKKSVEDKPTLIVRKVEGEFIVEMKADHDKSPVGQQEPYKPLIYKITRPDQERRLQKREKRKQRLIRQKVDEAWTDPYHPERCDEICGKAFRQTICPSGSLELLNEAQKKHEAYEEYLKNYSDGEESDSDCSSMDVDWEIHFTPPYEAWKAQ